MGRPHSVGVSFNYDDEDLDAWVLEAKRWARVVFLVTNEANNIDPIFTVNFSASLIIRNDIRCILKKFSDNV